MTSLNIMNSIICLGNTFDVSFLDVLWECVSYILETHWAWHRLQMILYFINWYGLTSSNFGSEPYWRWINEPGWKTHTLARFWGDRFPMAGPYAAWGCFVCIVLDTTSNILSQGEWNTHIQLKRQSDVWRIVEWFAKQFFLLECTFDLLARTTLFEEAVYVYECLSVVRRCSQAHFGCGGWGGDVKTFLKFAHMVDATQWVGIAMIVQQTNASHPPRMW